MTNPLLTIRFQIPFDEIRAEHIEPAIDEMLAEAQAAVDDIVAVTTPRTYENTLAALERATERLEWASTVAAHLESVATYAALRDAYEAIQPKLSRFWTGVILNEGLWKALRDLAESPEGKAMTGARARHLKRIVDEFRRNGAELNSAGRERITTINQELAELTTKYSQHLLDATNSFELVIDDETRLAGLPNSAVEAARESAAAKNRAGWRFTLQAPSLVPVLTYLDDRSIRERVWRAHINRATTAEFDNRPIVRRILQLRQEKATLLGYRDFADLVLEDRMAHDGRRARRFIDDLREKTRSFFDRESTALVEFRKTLENASTEAMQPWDLAYYAEKQRVALFDFDEEQLRPYFPIEQVLNGLFETVHRLFGVTIRSTSDLPVWDPSVRTFDILDSDQAHRASFYVDLYPRENKRSGAWMHGLIAAVPPAPHLALIAANVNPPVGDKPALLTHSEVETLFHEFGHLLHHCLSDVPIRSLAGTNVAWDFVELPSQIMENWCWERETLDLFARHFRTGEPIPAELFERMRNARTYRAATAQMRQLGFAAVDHAMHCEYDPSGDTDVMTYARNILQDYTPVPLPEPYGFIAGFGHLFSDAVGYGAGYYSYKWAEVLDADAFTRFRRAGVFSREIGQEFRQTILSRGNSDDPMELYKSFMGREPELEPLLVREGLIGDGGG